MIPVRMYSGSMEKNIYTCNKCGYKGTKMKVQNHCFAKCYSDEYKKDLDEVVEYEEVKTDSEGNIIRDEDPDRGEDNRE